MKLADLNTILQATGYPVAYLQFIETETDPLPDPPFIAYLSAFSSNMIADNKVHFEVDVVQIELYTDKKDLIAETKLETVLNDHELPYQTSEIYLESEKLHQKIYEVRLF